MIEGNLESGQDMGPFLGFIEFIPRLAGNDFFLVLQVVDEDFLEIQDPWMTFDE